MELSTLLAPQAVKVVSDVSSKKRLLQSISELAEQTVGVPAARIFESLQERESLGPTGVGQGVALPHARLPGLDKVCGLFMLIERPLEFEAVDKQPVDLVFALLAPEDAGVEHLKALAVVSRSMRDSSLCGKLRANSDPATLHTLLAEPHHDQAA